MRKRILGVVALVLASAVLVMSLFSGVAVGPAPQPPVEFDVNVQNTPLPVEVTNPPVEFDVNVQNTPLPVEVTNPTGMPIATNHSTSGLHGIGNGTDFEYQLHGFRALDVIEDQTVVFTGGSVTGHLVFSCDNGVGAVPAAGDVEVETTTGIYKIALPFNSLLRIEHVTAIKPRVYVFNPSLPGTADFAYEISCTVLWFIEE